MIEIPTECPFCGAKTEMVDSRLKCTNEDCPETMAHRLVNFSEKIKVLGLGIENARILVENGVTDYLLLITMNVEEGSKLLGKNGATLVSAYENLRQTPTVTSVQLLSAMGIDNISTSTAELLLEKFKLDDFYNPFGSLTVDVTSIDGIGDITADSLADYFNQNETLIQRLIMELKPIHQMIDVNLDSPIAGLSVVVTGNPTVDGVTYGRTEIKEFIKANGGTLKTSVSKRTDLVVVGESPGAAKINKANDLGIKIVNSEEFEELLHSYD